MIRCLAGLTGAVLLAAIAPASGPASAQTTYRYWSYWIGGDSGTWSYSARGPGFRVPPDGGVEGWRFVVSPKDGSQASPPSASSRYVDLCPNQPPAPAGQKRVAVVIDPGPPGIAPVGNTAPAKSVTCVTVAGNATGLQVLQKVASVRFHSSGLICGIAGFPASECPGQQSAATPAPTPSATSRAGAPGAAPAAAPAVADPPAIGQTTPREAATPSATATPPVPLAAASPAPSAVALGLGEQPPGETTSSPPAWIAAIGAAMIAALLGLALLIRRGRS